MRNYSAAVIGCGKIGSEFALDTRIRGIYTHAGAYSASPRTTLVAVCDSDQARVNACGDHWNVRARFSDAREMLEAVRPDVVSICSPDASHADILRLALNFGVRAIVVEKPIALDPQVARELVRDAAALDTVIVVNYTRRYAEGHDRVRALIKNGALGDIQAASGYYTKGVRHNGTHWFDLARFLLGEVTNVVAVDHVNDGSDDPTIDVRLGFASGARADLIGCTSAFSIFEMDIIGTRGRIRIADSGHVIELYEVADSPHYTGYRSLNPVDTWDGGMDNAMPRMIADCVACLDQPGRPVCSGDDGVAALEIAHAALGSLPPHERVAALS
jgi:predicted dehydrogenase